jgi:hypothetical protein
MFSSRVKITGSLLSLLLLGGILWTAAAAEPRADAVNPPANQTKITVNVFGAVEKPGAYQLPSNSTLLDALGAAGGWKGPSNPTKVSVLSGPPGEKPEVVIHDVDAILRGRAANPKIADHNTVVVAEKLF